MHLFYQFELFRAIGFCSYSDTDLVQAYYSQSMAAGGGGGQGMGPASASMTSSLPPLLPMAAQLSQYASSTAAASAGYSHNSAAGAVAPAADYSRRPLSVLF